MSFISNSIIGTKAAGHLNPARLTTIKLDSDSSVSKFGQLFNQITIEKIGFIDEESFQPSQYCQAFYLTNDIDLIKCIENNYEIIQGNAAFMVGESNIQDLIPALPASIQTVYICDIDKTVLEAIAERLLKTNESRAIKIVLVHIDLFNKSQLDKLGEVIKNKKNTLGVVNLTNLYDYRPKDIENTLTLLKTLPLYESSLFIFSTFRNSVQAHDLLVPLLPVSKKLPFRKSYEKGYCVSLSTSLEELTDIFIKIYRHKK